MPERDPAIEQEPTSGTESVPLEEQLLDRCTSCMRLRGGSCDGVFIFEDETRSEAA